MTQWQVITLQAFVAARVRYETAHHCERNKALQEAVEAQAAMFKAWTEESPVSESGN